MQIPCGPVFNCEEELQVNSEKTAGYSISDPVVELALTHSSYAHEHYAGKRHDNERLEFLGDAKVGTRIK